MIDMESIPTREEAETMELMPWNLKDQRAVKPDWQALVACAKKGWVFKSAQTCNCIYFRRTTAGDAALARYQAGTPTPQGGQEGPQLGTPR